MMILSRLCFLTVALSILFFSNTALSYQQLPFLDNEVGLQCIHYEVTENTITVDCDRATFGDLITTLPIQSVIEKLAGDGEYLLKANLRVSNDASFEMTSDGGLQYLKLADTNGIIVHGKILVDGVKITSWNTSSNEVIPQDRRGSVVRGYVQFDASSGSRIINSEFAYLGYNELGRRGFDLHGEGTYRFGYGPTHDMEIRGSKFHHMCCLLYTSDAADE